MKIDRTAELILTCLALLSSTPGSLAGQEWTRAARIGVLDGAEEYMFGRVIGAAVLSDGSIAVLDQLAAVVRVYDQEGRHLTSFGAPGDGPGEFRMPVSLAVTSGGVAVYDASLRRVVTLDHEGRHLETRKVGHDSLRFNELRPLRHSRWIGEEMLNGSRMLRGAQGELSPYEAMSLGLMVLGAQTTTELRRFHSGATFWFQEGGGSYGPVRNEPRHREVLWAVGGDSLLAVVDGVRGRIWWYAATPDGLVLGAARDLGLEPIPFAPTTRDSVASWARSRYGVTSVRFMAPEYKNRFSAVLLDDSARVWLRPRNSSEEPPTRYRVVGPDGSDAEVEVPEGIGLLAISANMLLAIRRDRYDVQYLEIYRR